ncbi:MAG TPA: response regulator transcription factor [Ilumatobacteraceae bacterium]|nr:response regulator transcription factor [Ilumatobacteraceae bacterium]
MAGKQQDRVRVVIVDDDALVRSALRLMLGGLSDIEVVGEAADGRQGVALADEVQPDVVLMDVRMPVMDGVTATAALCATARPPRIIVLTTFDADDYVLGAIAAGADGFLLKDTEPAEIVDAIRRVFAGEPMLSPKATETLIRRVREAAEPDASPDDTGRAARARLASLTERERDVAEPIGRGLSNAEIATELFLSVPTVKAHVSRVFDKLGVTNRVHIAILVHHATR